jgi:hypothetical protein
MTPRCAQHTALPVGRIRAQRDELSRRILAGELDDAELQIRQPRDSPASARCRQPRIPVPALTCCLSDGAQARKPR